ncbi:unnamed protein product [Rotaria sp. Silwood2]|nr:unnamed protein product [Rotaria sp. Silwood2]
MGMDKRIGKESLNAGPGFGGSCFPKDLLALAQVAKTFHTECQIIDSVISSNNQRPYDMVKKIYYLLNTSPISTHIDMRQQQTPSALCLDERQAKAIKYSLPFEINFSNKTIAVLGLTFKAGTDDIRSSAAIKIIQILLDREAIIQTFDPMGMPGTKKYLAALNYKNIFYAQTALSACQNSDIILITTEWAEFKTLPWETIKSQTKAPIILDLRNILDADQLNSIGYRIQSSYSFLESALTIESIVELACKHKMPAICLADRGNLFGSLEFALNCAKAGIQAINGALINLVYAEREFCEILLIAKDNIGYKNLLQLVSDSFTKNDRKICNHITLDDLIKYNAGLIILSGYADGIVGKNLIAKKNELAIYWATKLQSIFGDRFYCEIMRHNLDRCSKRFPYLWNIAQKQF